ncbi:MAG: hypothetical protein ABSA12_15815 [Verrucomicrobiia bacterium]
MMTAGATLAAPLIRNEDSWSTAPVKANQRAPIAPNQLVYLEEFPDLPAARRRELQIKRKKSRRYIDWLIAGQGGKTSS